MHRRHRFLYAHMRPLKTSAIFWLLELYALALATLQWVGGVRTDEAKYLLSIPYPHPPLVRSVMAFTAALPLHEFFWRFVFASMLVQCVWLFVDLGRVLTRTRRLSLAAGWLLSSAVVLQSGSIVMAVITAACGAVFVWTALHPTPPSSPAAIGCLWLASLFTAYQAVLFMPLVLVSLLRTHTRRSLVLAYIGLPLVALALYTLTNPHALLTMAHLSGQDAVIPLTERLLRIGWVWLVGGAAIASIAGTVGILTSTRLDLVTTFALVFGFVILTSQQYYAILFTPLFMGGLFLLLCKRRLTPGIFTLAQIGCCIAIVWISLPSLHPTQARSISQHIQTLGLTGSVLIDGYFGHEWQYESSLPIRRFSQELSAASEAEASVFICTQKDGCDDDVNDELWIRLPGTALPMWVRR